MNKYNFLYHIYTSVWNYTFKTYTKCEIPTNQEFIECLDAWWNKCYVNRHLIQFYTITDMTNDKNKTD